MSILQGKGIEMKQPIQAEGNKLWFSYRRLGQ